MEQSKQNQPNLLLFFIAPIRFLWTYNRKTLFKKYRLRLAAGWVFCLRFYISFFHSMWWEITYCSATSCGTRGLSAILIPSLIIGSIFFFPLQIVVVIGLILSALYTGNPLILIWLAVYIYSGRITLSLVFEDKNTSLVTSQTQKPNVFGKASVLIVSILLCIFPLMLHFAIPPFYPYLHQYIHANEEIKNETNTTTTTLEMITGQNAQ